MLTDLFERRRKTGMDPFRQVGQDRFLPLSHQAITSILINISISRHKLQEEVVFDCLFDPEDEPVIPVAKLKRGRLGSVHWSTQISGILIPAEAAQELERLWMEHIVRQLPAPKLKT